MHVTKTYKLDDGRELVLHPPTASAIVSAWNESKEGYELFKSGADFERLCREFPATADAIADNCLRGLKVDLGTLSGGEKIFLLFDCHSVMAMDWGDEMVKSRRGESKKATASAA